MLVLTCFVLLVGSVVCHGDCLGFSFGASIPVVLYGVAYFLLGTFQTFLCMALQLSYGHVRPWTVLSVY